MPQTMTDIINNAFTSYAGAVLQSRALPDVRDCFKPSARQIFRDPEKCTDRYVRFQHDRLLRL